MQITHEEAHRLIQFDTDSALKPSEKKNLVAHLEACAECQAYAMSMKGIESLLRPLLQRNWNKQPVPFSVAALTGKTNPSRSESAFLATRIAVIGVICMGFLFSVWQFTISGQATPDLSVASVPPIPTPSTQFIHMTSTSNNCEARPYVVKEYDTVERIAQRFSISQEDMLRANNLNTETLRPGMEILISTCAPTPTGTVNALTTIYTPSSEPITFTPGG